jgi:hypothetical protein
MLCVIYTHADLLQEKLNKYGAKGSIDALKEVK